MATWISHMMIVDNLLKTDLDLDKTAFCVGNVAPDCNVENEDWTEFTPPRKVTHWMTGRSKLTADYEGFYNEYIKDKTFTSKEEYSFFIGYYAHLITDVLFQAMVRDDQRVERCFERIKNNSGLREKIKGYPENFDTLKIMAYEPGEESLDEFVFFDDKEYETFIKDASSKIYKMIYTKIREKS